MRAVRLAALALPLAGLAGLWGLSDHLSRQGDEWEVPIMGYDPRDILRGHYVEFAYDWPGLDDTVWREPLNGLCLIGSAPVIDRAVTASAAELAACAHPVRGSADGVYGSDALLRGRLYAGQARARELDKALRDQSQRAFVRFRLAPDGAIVPLDIVLRARGPGETRAAR
jgi:hypothetical protein